MKDMIFKRLLGLLAGLAMALATIPVAHAGQAAKGATKGKAAAKAEAPKPDQKAEKRSAAASHSTDPDRLNAFYSDLVL